MFPSSTIQTYKGGVTNKLSENDLKIQNNEFKSNIKFNEIKCLIDVHPLFNIVCTNENEICVDLQRTLYLAAIDRDRYENHETQFNFDRYGRVIADCGIPTESKHWRSKMNIKKLMEDNNVPPLNIKDVTKSFIDSCDVSWY
jgi:hypothetical protein